MAKKFQEVADKAEEEFRERMDEVKTKVSGMGPFKLTLLAVFTAITILSFVFFDYIFGSKTVFSKDFGSDILNTLWSAVPNIIRCVQVITVFTLITTVILYIIKRYFTKTPRGTTVAQLVSNLIKWVVAIILVIAVLAIWGVDTTALITGAGVITLVVGLGLQKLIEDVVAGLFIIFENEFNVGDIVTIDGFRGEVVSIGIRTTKVKVLGNVKIFNNSAITGVLNQTMDLSVGRSYVCVEYGSLPIIEEVIAENLPKLVIEGVIGGVMYDGVNELGASGATLQFSGTCKENDYYAVQRRMNMRLAEMLTANGVKLAYNQLVVHTAGDNENKIYAKTVDKPDK